MTPSIRPRQRCGLLWAAALVFATLCANSVDAQPTRSSEPLASNVWPIRDGFLLSNGFLEQGPIRTTPLAPSRWELDFVVTLANTVVQSGFLEVALETRGGRAPVDLEFLRRHAADEPSGYSYHLDGELTRSAFYLRRGFNRGIEVEVALPLLKFGGGTLDRPIEAFHNVFRADQDGRLGLPRDTSAFFFQGPDFEHFGAPDSETSLGNIDLRLRRTLAPRGRWRPAIEVAVKLPTSQADPRFVPRSFDAGVQLPASVDVGRGQLHLSAGLMRLGAWDELGLPAQWAATAGSAYERPLGRRLSFLAQLTMTQSPFRTLPYFRLAENFIYYGTVGLNLQVNSRGALLFAMTENFVHFENSTDVSLHVGWRLGV